ncbi:MAG: hypothetical protein INQ03_23075 [Candidatus Heimdallarchaeota archaeon]|nr:hypothetical protein [Candidatus Heimdallarchaeota archaeon]
MFITIFASVIIYIFPINPESYTTTYLILISLSTMGILGTVIYPYFKPIYPPMRENSDHKTNGELDPYYEIIRFNLVIYAVGPFTFLTTVAAFLSWHNSDTVGASITGTVAVFFWIILLTFNTMKIYTEGNELVVKMGPKADRFKADEMQLIYPTKIKAIREFLGYGKRIGTDGTIGYITGMKTGIKVEMTSGKNYVISTTNQTKLLEVLKK